MCYESAVKGSNLGRRFGMSFLSRLFRSFKTGSRGATGSGGVGGMLVFECKVSKDDLYGMESGNRLTRQVDAALDEIAAAVPGRFTESKIFGCAEDSTLTIMLPLKSASFEDVASMNQRVLEILQRNGLLATTKRAP